MYNSLLVGLDEEIILQFVSLTKWKKSATQPCAFSPADFSPQVAHPSAKALRLKSRNKPYTNTLPAI